MRFRKLRIAWSVFCGIACVLLIALWIRSYWWADGLYGPIFQPKSLVLTSGGGALELGIDDAHRRNRWYTVHCREPRTIKRDNGNMVIIQLDRECSLGKVVVPDWSATLVIAVLASLPWLRWRFTLRTLLIATTLVAVVLGLVVAVTRQ